ncbi:MAG: hypothetical protein N2689_10185 [Verrucomicrobiae bacterium]|nr:hypothetical protein [Verrucomicrobiae bacterium]
MILRSIDGKFYQIPDVEAAQYLIPADKVQETLRAAGAFCQQSGTTGLVRAYHGPPPPPGPVIPVPNPLALIFGPPPPPPVYYNYNNYRNYWGGW